MNRKALLLVGLLAVLLFIRSASANLVYQETADAYLCVNQVGNGWQAYPYGCNATIDGNWSTYGTANTATAEGWGYRNYTKPMGFINATWMVKDGTSSKNLTFLPSCLNQNPAILQLAVATTRYGFCPAVCQHIWTCYNGSDYVSLDGGGSNNVYEEGIWWEASAITNCSSGINSLTFNNLLESNQSAVNVTLDITYTVMNPQNNQSIIYAFSNAANITHSFCINPNWISYQVNAVAIYYASGYSHRTYYNNNLTLTNQTQNVNLYLLGDSLSNPIYIKTLSLLEPKIQNALVTAYTSGGLLAGMAYTDANGMAVMPFQDNVIYRFAVQKSGYATLTQDSYIYPDTYTYLNPLNLQLSTSAGNQYEYYDYVGLIDYLCAENVTARTVNCTFTDNSGQSSRFCLNVGRYLLSGFDQECFACSAEKSGTLGCSITSTTGNQTFFYDLSVNFAQGTYPLYSHYISFISGTTYGLTGVFAAMMLVVTMAMIGLWSPAASVILGVVGLIISVWLGIYVVSVAPLIGIVIVAGIIVYKARS